MIMTEQDRESYTDTQDRESYTDVTDELPIPGDQAHGAIVVASVWLDVDDRAWLLLLLVPGPPYTYYRVVTVEDDVIVGDEQHPNIVPAVHAYEQNGGDY